MVGIWVTNDPRCHTLGTKLLQKWGCRCVGTWYWLKVNRGGDPICELDSLHRKPYEMLLIGVKGLSATGDPFAIPPKRLFCSVPEAHSRKPQGDALFGELIARHGGHGTMAPCELFARNLQPGWTSWGNQVLLFQEESHFSPRR